MMQNRYLFHLLYFYLCHRFHVCVPFKTDKFCFFHVMSPGYSFAHRFLVAPNVEGVQLKPTGENTSLHAVFPTGEQMSKI